MTENIVEHVFVFSPGNGKSLFHYCGSEYEVPSWCLMEGCAALWEVLISGEVLTAASH